MDIRHCKDIFENYGGMMRTKDLEKEKIRYRNVRQRGACDTAIKWRKRFLIKQFAHTSMTPERVFPS